MEKPQYTAAHLKGMNRHVVYDFIRERGATSKAQIVKETGISPPTVIKIVSYLVERGLVVEAGEGAAGVGRRPQLLAINGPGRFSAVFALEGSFLSMGLVDISGRVLHRQKTRTAQDFGAFLAEVRDGLVSSLLHAAGADPARLIGVGVRCPGRMTRAPRAGLRARHRCVRAGGDRPVDGQDDAEVRRARLCGKRHQRPVHGRA
ncbi:MAG: hypothetical protein ACLRZH_00830 [Ruthenibacterium lactatiformans]